MRIDQVNTLVNSDLFGSSAGAAQPAKGSPSFAEVLGTALNRVEQDQQAAADAATRLATGEVKDLAEVTIASERANLSLGLTIQVRNKMLEAYQEIMRMPL